MPNIVLKVDHRESKLKSHIESKGSSWSFQYENLPHGDIQVWVDDQLLFVLERKSLDDLAASIKDGRYHNQKTTLLQSGYQPSQLYYIIEGSWKRWKETGSEFVMQKGAIINTLLRDKMGIFYTKHEEDTVDLLYEIYMRVLKNPTQYLQSKEHVREVTVMSQNDKITPAICYRNMLCQIPGISQKTAEGLAVEFPTMQQLIQQLSLLHEEGRKARLEQIKINNRKLSSRVISGLLTYLFGQE